MNKIIKIVTSTVLSFVLIQSNLIAQVTSEIDYSTFGSSDCNVFRPNPTTTAPILINGRTHNSTCGQPKLNVNTLQGGIQNNSVILDAEIIGTNNFRGTEYKIDYNFKQGYNYKITVNALGKTPTNSFDPYCKLLLSFSSFSANTLFGKSCIGTESFNTPYPFNENDNQILPIGNFGNRIWGFNNLPSSKQSLYLSSNVRTTDDSYYFSFVQIQKVTIVETLPSANFTINPSTLNLEKGISATQTFAINNINNTNGVTGYTWNIGATPNGWLYNGTPAPAIISTTGNSISLSSQACSNSVSNISAKAIINNLAYSSNICVVSLNIPIYSINPVSSVCPGTTTNISVNAPTGSTINWAITNEPLGVTNTTTGNPCLISVPSTVTNGSFNLIATITTVCGDVWQTPALNFYIGIPYFGASYSNGVTGGNPVAFYIPSSPPFNFNNVCLGYNGIPNVYIDAEPIGANSITWSVPSGYETSGFNLYTGYGNRAYFGWNFGGTNPPGYIQGSVNNVCGTTSQIFAFQQVNCGTPGGDPCAEAKGVNYFTISPNPASDNIKVGVTNRPAPPNCDGLKALSTSNGVVLSAIKIYDNLGNLVKSYKTKNAKSATIQISNLIAGSYLVEIIQGNYIEKQQIIIRK